MSRDWVILKKDKIVEQNKDIRVILDLGEKKYKDEEVIISKIPSGDSCFY